MQEHDFENLVALCLLKHTYAKRDYEGKRYSLKYLRTKDKHEIDFALVHDDKLETMIEVKHSDSNLNKTLLAFHEKYHIPAIQVVKDLHQEKTVKGIDIRRAEAFLSELLL